MFGAAAPAGAATESFALTSASLPGQSSVTWQGPPVSPPATPNVFPGTVSLSGQIDSSTGAISGATLSLPPLPQPEQQGENTTFTFTEVHPGTATGSFDSTTGAVTLNDSLTLTFTGTGTAGITCVSTPIDVALSGTWDSTSENVTLAASGFTIPQFPADSGAACSLAASSLNASPGGVAGAVGNAFSLALHGQFAPGLPTTTTLSATPNSPQPAGTSVVLTATVVDPSTAGTPTGNVAFDANGVNIGTEALSASGTVGTATATLTTTTLPQSANQLIAVYSGDTTYATSTSDTVPYTIQAAPTITSTFPSQFTAGATSFPTPTPFTLTVSNPTGGATYTNNLFMYLGIAGIATQAIQLSYEDQAGNWCPFTLSTHNEPPSGSGFQGNWPAVFFGGLGTSPCGFASAFSLDPGASVTFNLEISFSEAPPVGEFAGPIYLNTAVETGGCTSSSSCTAAAPLSGATAVTSTAVTTVLPPDGPGTVPTTVTMIGFPSSSRAMRSGFGMYMGVKVQEDPTSPIYGTTNPSGTVQFLVDGQLVATVALTSNTEASSSPAYERYTPTSALAPGTHTETVNYPGDFTYAPSTASRTFAVDPGPPTGTPFVCSVTDDLGSPLGNYNAYVTATGTGVPTAATSGTSVTTSNVSVTLDLDPSVSTAGNPNQLNSGQANQTIGFSPGTGIVDAGPVTFALNSEQTDILGTWSGLSTTAQVIGSTGSTVPIGVSSISFNYEFNGSVSCTAVSQPATIGTVGIIGTTLAVSPSGSSPVGAPVTLTATVSPLPPPATSIGNPTRMPGQVDFYDGSTYLGTANVDPTAGTASLAVNNLTSGDHQLTAVWSGYSGVPPNTSNTVDYAIGTTTTTALASSANPANAASPVTFTATVSPPDGATTQPTGDVSFTSDGNPITGCDNQPLSMASPPTATCTTSFGAGESHAIVATYGGDATYLGSASDPLTQTMLAGTNTTILSTKDPSPPGNVTFWAGVSPSAGTGATPTGTVAFSIDGSVYKACNAAPLGLGGGASCTVSFKAGTTHKVYATYPGSTTYSGSKSSTLTQTVTGSKSSTTPKDTGGSATLGSGKSLTSGQSLTGGSYRLVMQSDGNLVEYQGSKALWASGTSGHSGTGVTMQKDGNLVEYNRGHAIWASKTAGHEGSHLTLQGSDGNVVIYTPAGNAVWATGT